MFLIERITAVLLRESTLVVHVEVAGRGDPLRSIRFTGVAARQLVGMLEERLCAPDSQFAMLGPR